MVCAICDVSTVGRAWKSSELRLKSFDDLHKLWYVLLKEKNALLTEFYDCQARNVSMPHPERLDKVKRKQKERLDRMEKRLKGVLTERKMAYEKLNSKTEALESRIPETPKME